MAMLIVTLSLIAMSVNADVNERRILRDASGIFKGLVVGGTYTVTYDNGSPGFSFAGPTIDFREPVSFKDGRFSRVVTDEDFSGSGVAGTSGMQNDRVTRGGKRISVIISKGVLKEDDGPDKGPWTGGRANGVLDDKGSFWKGNSTASASQRNSSVTGNPPDHTRAMSGRKISCKG
jgi:hypothetical protein